MKILIDNFKIQKLKTNIHFVYKTRCIETRTYLDTYLVTSN